MPLPTQTHEVVTQPVAVGVKVFLTVEQLRVVIRAVAKESFTEEGQKAYEVLTRAEDALEAAVA